MNRLAFAFDLDGTIVDSRRDIVFCVNKTLDFYQLPELPFDRIVSYVGNGARVLMERVLGKNLMHIDLDEAVRKFREIYLEHCIDESYIFDGIYECMDIIKRGGHYLFVITNKPSPHSIEILKHFDILPKLDGLFCQDTMKALKPDPITINELLEKYCLKSKDFYMIGDSKVDVDFAHSAGAISIMVGYGGVISREEYNNTNSNFKADTTSDLIKIIENIVGK